MSHAVSFALPRWAVFLAGLLLATSLSFGWHTAALAQAPVPKGSAPGATAAPGASAAPTAAPEPSAAPKGAPTAAPEDRPLPPGHPPMSPAPRAPTGRGGAFRPTPDRIAVDESLPGDAIAVKILDADNQPVPQAPLQLHILHSSVTEGEKRELLTATTDAQGEHLFADLKRGSGVSYQVKSRRGEASFASQAFALREESGIKVMMHVYEPTSKLRGVALAMEAVVLMDIKQDSIAINHLLRILNLDRRAYVAEGIEMPLPDGAKAFSQQESGGEQSIVERDGKLVLVGTYPPGNSELTYRYQVDLEGSSSQTLDLPLPPRVLASRVVVGAGNDMTLQVAGFPPAERGRWHDGKRVLQTSTQPDLRGGLQALRSEVRPTLLRVTLTGIPTPGSGRYLASVLAALAVGGGFFYLFRARQRKELAPDQVEDLEEARRRLLEELAILEKARLDGEVGPRTYERVRVALTDALARIMGQLGQVADEDDPPQGGAGSRPKRRKKKRKKRRRSEAPAAS